MCLWLSQARAPDYLAEPGMLSHYPIYIYKHSEACWVVNAWWCDHTAHGCSFGSGVWCKMCRRTVGRNPCTDM